MARFAGAWRIGVRAPAAIVGAVQDVLEAVCGNVSAFETEPDGPWTVEAYSARKPDRTAVETRLALVAAAARLTEIPDCDMTWIAPTDWVAETKAAFPPVRCGRFWIHGSHHRARPPAGTIALAIDATVAFGTGEHPTTQGCLKAIEWLHRRRQVRQVLDLGCGSGILAIAACKKWHPQGAVMAADLDPDAVRVTRAHGAANGVATRVRAVRSHGLQARGVGRARHYDLILANILARPLVGLARPLARSLAPGGTAVLSGLLSHQAASVTAAYRLQGLVLTRRFQLGPWPTLIFRRRPHFQQK